MKDHIINLEIPMYERASIAGLGASLREEVDGVVEMRDLAHGFVGLYVGDGGLGEAEGFEEGDLAVVEAGGFAEGGEGDGGGGGAVEAGELADRVVPPGMSRGSQILGGMWCGKRVGSNTYIAVRSSGVTPGMEGSSKILPSRYSMM